MFAIFKVLPEEQEEFEEMASHPVCGAKNPVRIWSFQKTNMIFRNKFWGLKSLFCSNHFNKLKFCDLDFNYSVILVQNLKDPSWYKDASLVVTEPARLKCLVCDWSNVTARLKCLVCDWPNVPVRLTCLVCDWPNVPAHIMWLTQRTSTSNVPSMWLTQRTSPSNVPSMWWT